MLKRNRLVCAMKAITVLLFLVIALPAPVSAQSDQAARVKITDPSGRLGDVLLVRDGNDIVLYGLAESVPPISAVTITTGAQTFNVYASYTGQFPIRTGTAPIRIVDGVNIQTASISVLVNDGSPAIEGTISLDLNDPAILERLIAYQGGDYENGTPPHMLLDVVSETDPDLVGKVLLTQYFLDEGAKSVILDTFEGISGSGGATETLRSAPPFSTIGVYLEPIADINNPDRTKRLLVVQTENFIFGNFVSNGSFFPFSITDANSSVPGERPDILYLRITTEDENGDQKIFLATVQNDVSAAIEGTPVVITNNERGNADAPGADGLAVIQGIADPYSIITAYRAQSVSSDMLASAIADGAGNFSLLVPPVYTQDGLYDTLPEVFLSVLDPLSNVSTDLLPVGTDTESVIFEQPTAVLQSDNTFDVSGVVEPLSFIIIVGRSVNGDAPFFAGGGIAEADGTFTFNALPAYDYVLDVVDQAGNHVTSDVVPAKQSTIDPYDLTFTRVFPNIQVDGKAEPGANVLVFGFPLDQVPDSADPSDTQPVNSFYIIQTVVDENGEFTVRVPGGVSPIIYFQAIDQFNNESRFIGLDLGDASSNLVMFDPIEIINNSPGIPDVINSRTVNADTGEPVSGIFVAAFRMAVNDPSADFPFAGMIGAETRVSDDGTFSLSIPDRDPNTGEFFESFYLVALDRQEDLTYREIGFRLIDAASGLDRQGPVIGLAPLSSDIQLLESGHGTNDIMNITRIYPAGMGAGSASLPADALPLIAVIIDDNDDDEIDVLSSSIKILDVQFLSAVRGNPYGINLPMPGVYGLDLGDNYWDPNTQSVVGRSIVFVALMDAFGNLSPNPLPVDLDVFIQDPDPIKITSRGDVVFGGKESVEADSMVTIYANADKSGWIGTTQADPNGSFAISPLALTQTKVYISARDDAGNESRVIRLNVSDVTAKQYLILDNFGLLHTPAGNLTTGLDSSNPARALAGVDGNDALFYVLSADGSISKMGESGSAPLRSEQLSISGQFARDLIVTDEEPFAGYVLLGNGVIVPFGDAPFFGDLVQMQRGYTSPNRLRLPGSTLLYDDLNDNGSYDTEDKNGNGQLDIVVGVNGEITYNEDENGNGELDLEPLVDPSELLIGFETDLARKLDVVKDEDGTVKGYVVMDGYGILWAFGDDIGADVVNVNPQDTNGIATDAIFRSFKLIVEDGKIVDFVTLNGFGQLFGVPDGLLGAGPANQPWKGNLFVNTYVDPDGDTVKGSPSFDFDIARDVEVVITETAAGEKYGFYVLDGFGGIHAAGVADDIEDTPFLGFDIARDLEFGISQ